MKSFGLLTLLILLSSYGAGQVPRTIIVGTVYDVFHDQFATDSAFAAGAGRDIGLMKKSGISHVMVFPVGEWDPLTRRHLWTRTDSIVRKIERAGMKFVPVMLKEEQCAAYFPIWKFREIDGLWNESARDNGRENNRDNVDFADPCVYPLLVDYFRDVIDRYGKSPALSFYNIWNEPHYSSTAPHVIARFKTWLRNKYGLLTSLGRSWGETYSSWEEVSPFLTSNWRSSMPGIDWTVFRSELNGILLGELIASLRQFDTVHAVNANPVGTPWASFGQFGGYTTDSWPIASRDDIHGISYYPDAWERDHNLAPCPWWLHNLAFNTIRCSSPGGTFILTELYTNAQNGLALNGYLSKEDVTLLAWTALANDCKGMIYWQWLPFARGRQSLGRGLCRIDGTLAPRGAAVKEFAGVMKQYGELLYRARLRKPRAAILVDLTGLLKTLGQTVEPATTRFMYESSAGVYKSLYEGNIGVDILRMDRGIGLATLKDYRIVYLPFQVVMRREMAEVLKEYVKEGGWVVADARTATIDENDLAYETSPGAGLDELFGAVRLDWSGRNGEFRVNVRSSAGLSALSFEGRYFREEIRPGPGAEVTGSFASGGAPAIIRHRYGAGTAILSAVPLGASYYGMPGNPVNRLLVNFARESGVTPGGSFVSSRPGSVSVSVHDAGNDMVLYAVNADSAAASGGLEAVCGGRVVRSVTDILTGARIPFSERRGTLSIPLVLKGRTAGVFYVESSR